MRRLLPSGLFWLALLGLAAGSRAAWDNPPRRLAPDLRHGTFVSASLRKPVGYNIGLPPAYATNLTERFPVIYYLHGYDGHESSYLEYADHWREAVRRFGPCLLVFVNGGATSFYCDSPDGTVPGETVVLRELIPHVDRTYRTLASRAGRSLHGYSMGGFGALKLAFKFPDTFGSVAAYGATLGPAEEFQRNLGRTFTKMFGPGTDRFEQNQPDRLAARLRPNNQECPALRLVVGTRDEFLGRHRDLHKALEQLHLPHAYVELPGLRHDKDDLYPSSALDSFAFSWRHCPR